MKFIGATIVGYSVNVLNGHMLMVHGFTLPPGKAYEVKLTNDFKTWTKVQDIPASQVQQQLNYSIDLTAGLAVFVTYNE
jgi:hypothetical protein